LNEILRRALLQAQLIEDDVAALLAVDPKTVRRWTEGRVPFLRHRWELARLLGRDEADLWPQLSVIKSRPEEVLAVYPRRDAVPQHMWRKLIGSAEREINILANSGNFVAERTGALAALDSRARAGVTVRICLRDGKMTGSSRVPAQYEMFLGSDDVEIRVHQAVVNNSIYKADDELLVCQYAYGIPADRSPVLHLRCTGAGELVLTYLRSFEQVWTAASPLN
jgi:hypothetical protein